MAPCPGTFNLGHVMSHNNYIRYIAYYYAIFCANICRTTLTHTLVNIYDWAG